MNLAFHKIDRLGDNVVALKAIYAIKSLYPQVKLSVLTNSLGKNLYTPLEFIDKIINLEDARGGGH